MAVNMKLGVDLGSFNSGINQAKAQIRTFDAALKSAESQFKATGNAESAMTTKMSALTGKLSAQKKIVDDYRKALEAMTKNNVDPMSSAFQKMQKDMLLAESAMYDTQAALNGLAASEQAAAAGADQLTQSVNGIGKKMSLEQVIGGIDKITNGLERAAQKAIQFGEKLWDTIMESARRADDTATMAEMYGIDLQEFKRMQALVAGGLDTSVDAMLSSQDKLKKGIGSGTKTVIEALEEIGLYTKVYGSPTGSTDAISTLVTEDGLDLMFRAGQAILAYGDGIEAEAKQEAQAQALFGRSWKELVPLFKQYSTVEEYRAALDSVSVSSEDATKNAAELADRVGTLETTWTSLKDEVIGAVAPGLTAGADALNNVLSTILEYLQKPEGQEMLTKLGESVAGLFDDLTKVNPEDVVSNFVTVFDSLTSGLEFLSKNWNSVVRGLEAIGVAFAGLKVAEGVLTFVQLINGFGGLGHGGAGGSVAAAGNQVLAAAGSKLVMNGIESTLGTTIGSSIASVLTSTPMTVMLAAASIGALAHAIYTVVNNGDPLKDFLTNSGIEADRAEEIAEDMRNAYNPFDTKANERATRMLKQIITGEKQEPPEVEVKTVAEPGANEDLAAQIGEVTIPVNLRVNMGGGAFSGGGGGGGLSDYFRDTLFGSFRPGYANGIPYVPDTRLAWLHRGETVTPAREIASRNFSSNLYVENMVMNNGTDAAGLASAMAAAQRRTMSGYGS